MPRKTGAVVRFYNHPELPGVHAVHGVNVGNDFTRHTHNGLCIGLVEKGERIVEQRGMQAVVPEGSLFVINPGVSHRCKPRHAEHSYLVFCIDQDRVKKTVSRLFGRKMPAPHFTSICIDDRRMRMKMNRLFLLMKEMGTVFEIEAALNTLLIKLIMHAGEFSAPAISASHNTAVKRACTFIDSNYTHNFTLKDLSKAAHLSPYHLQRLFLEEKGVSPHEYSMQQKIKKARELLSKGHSIAGVAFDLGFADQSHFTRSFKKATGTTPGAFLA
jgi:AraC-like DNA-binding protein